MAAGWGSTIHLVAAAAATITAGSAASRAGAAFSLPFGPAYASTLEYIGFSGNVNRIAIQIVISLGHMTDIGHIAPQMLHKQPT